MVTKVNRRAAMNIYTVSFFGHRYIERGLKIEHRLDKLLHNLITQKEYVDFLIGRDGEFDLLASASIKRAINDLIVNELTIGVLNGQLDKQHPVEISSLNGSLCFRNI